MGVGGYSKLCSFILLKRKASKSWAENTILCFVLWFLVSFFKHIIYSQFGYYVLFILVILMNADLDQNVIVVLF